MIKYMPRKNSNDKDMYNPNYDINDEERAVGLTFAFVYSLRLADRNKRKEMLKNVQ